MTSGLLLLDKPIGPTSHDVVALSLIHISVWFHRQKVGEYYADIIVDEKVILELKAAESLVPCLLYTSRCV